MKDLFGNELTLEEAERLLRRKSPIPRGHAAPPGTGPAGETCGSCANYTLRRYSKTYRKCWLTRDRWTGGGASDIRARDPACKLWQERQGKPQERGGYYDRGLG